MRRALDLAAAHGFVAIARPGQLILSTDTPLASNATLHALAARGYAFRDVSPNIDVPRRYGFDFSVRKPWQAALAAVLVLLGCAASSTPPRAPKKAVEVAAQCADACAAWALQCGASKDELIGCNKTCVSAGADWRTCFVEADSCPQADACGNPEQDGGIP